MAPRPLRSARTALAVAAAVLASLAALGCAAPDPRCEPLCRQLLATSEEGGCEYTTWPDLTTCVQGCGNETYRRPDAGDLLGCYEAAAAACNDFAMLQCRLASGALPSQAAF